MAPASISAQFARVPTPPPIGLLTLDLKYPDSLISFSRSSALLFNLEAEELKVWATSHVRRPSLNLISVDASVGLGDKDDGCPMMSGGYNLVSGDLI